MNARLEPMALVQFSECLTHIETNVARTTDTDFRLPDEPNLPSGYSLDVGGAGWYDLTKTGLDCLAAALILIVATPFVLISALIIRLTSQGPAFYTQMRLGRGGKPFVIY